MASIIAIVIAYLLGSINMSILLSKVMKFPDPRDQGSGSAGATNVLRTIGKNQAAVVLVGDALKGIIAVLIGRMLGAHGFLLAIVGLAAVVGHIFPVYFKFKGGKGVATALGSVLALTFWIGIVAIIVWAAVAYIFKYSSLASLCALGAATILFLVAGKFDYFIIMLFMTGLIVWKHQENIQRLRSGTENKIDFNKSYKKID